VKKYFETRYGAGVGQEVVAVHPHQEALWATALGAQRIEDALARFDLTPAAAAIPLLDAAILRFNHDPESLRPLLSPDDALNLRGNRMVLEQIRRTLADHDDATISGVIEDS